MRFLRQLFGRWFANSDAPPFEGDVDFEDNSAEYERYVIDRSCVVLRYKEPFVRWVHRQLKKSGEPQTMPTLVELNQDATAYLLERHEDTYSHKEVRQQVDDDFLFFFKRELEQWEECGDEWPSPLTLKLFHQWFDVQVVKWCWTPRPPKHGHVHWIGAQAPNVKQKPLKNKTVPCTPSNTCKPPPAPGIGGSTSAVREGCTPNGFTSPCTAAPRRHARRRWRGETRC